MNVIFLDIDGVLNSHRTFLVWNAGSLGLRSWRIRQGRVPAGTPLTIDDVRLDPVAVELLRALTEACDAKIVISSTWRLGTAVEEFHEMFDLYGWDTRGVVIDKTKNLDNAIRGVEIDEWTQRCAPGATRVILDDDSDMTDAQKNSGEFVRVDSEFGLSVKNVQEAARQFGVDFQGLTLCRARNRA